MCHEQMFVHEDRCQLRVETMNYSHGCLNYKVFTGKTFRCRFYMQEVHTSKTPGSLFNRKSINTRTL